MAKTVHARTVAVQSLDYKYGKIVVPPYEVDIEFTQQEEAALNSGITAGMIPSNASSQNQLATHRDVATSSATFQGTYNSVTDLSLTTAATHSDIAAALGTTVTGADNNDYCYVQVPVNDITPTRIATTDRYKFDGTAWAYEYSLGDTDLAPYRQFKVGWHTNTTLLQFCQDVAGDSDVIVGDLYLGQLSCSGLPTGMSNGEVAVQVNQGLSGKLLLLTITSTNLAPYHWEQSFYNDTLYGWKSWEMPMQIEAVASGTTTLSAEINKYYDIAGSVGTLAVTLPQITGATTVSSLVLNFTTSSTPNVTLTAAGGATIAYYDGYAIEASKSYELNCMWNGTKWVVAYGVIS